VNALEKLGVALVALSLVLNIAAVGLFIAMVRFCRDIDKRPAYAFRQLVDIFPKLKGRRIQIDDSSVVVWSPSAGGVVTVEDASYADDDKEVSP
jgi:hypothetical protein